MKKVYGVAVVMIVGLTMLGGCAAKTEKKVFTTLPVEELGFSTELLEVDMTGVEEEYHFLYVSDLHIITETGAVAPEQTEEVLQRIENYRQPSGESSAEVWLRLANKLDECNADAILLGGDLVDFACEENVECLKEGLRMIETPVIYVGADHDFRPYYCDGVAEEDIPLYYQEFAGMEETPVLEMEEFSIVGFNNSTSQMTESALKKLEEVIEKEKPIMLLSHVPFLPQEDESLAELSKQVKGDRVLLWGEECYYRPKGATEELLDILYQENSPIQQVVSGHLHHTWDGMLTEGTGQHVFAHAASGNVGIIVVK